MGDLEKQIAELNEFGQKFREGDPSRVKAELTPPAEHKQFGNVENPINHTLGHAALHLEERPAETQLTELEILAKAAARGAMLTGQFRPVRMSSEGGLEDS